MSITIMTMITTRIIIMLHIIMCLLMMVSLPLELLTRVKWNRFSCFSAILYNA